MIWLWLPPLLVAALMAGAYVVALLDGACARWFGGSRIPPGALAAAPLHRCLQSLQRQRSTTERPDSLGRWLAPLVYLGLAAIALALVPLGPRLVLLDATTGIVVWGALEAVTVVAVFLHGWSQNSLFPLIGGYRFVAVGLSAMLLSMFVLIGAALPAESLSLPAIVESQRTLWNALRQPLGLPLFLLLGLALSLRGPLDFADSADLAGGTSAEDSGILRAIWQLARAWVLVGFAAVAATVFLGGHLGPVLPGPLWLALKTLVLLAVLVTAGHLLARPDTSRTLTLLWTVLLPLAFVDLVIAGLGSLP